MKGILTYKGAVTSTECDSNGHLNVIYYMAKFENAGYSIFTEIYGQKFDSRSNIGVVVLEHHIKYYKEVFEGDIINIKSTLENIGNKSFTIFHKMYLDDEATLISTMKGIFVFFDKVNRKAILIPEERKNALLKNLNKK